MKKFCIEMPKVELATIYISFESYKAIGKTIDLIVKKFMKQQYPHVDNFYSTHEFIDDGYEITVFAVGEVLEFKQIPMD